MSARAAKSAKYQPGDRVVSTANWHRQKPGVVTRPGRGTSVMVRWDGEDKDERVYLDGLRPEAAVDVAKREREQAMRAWRDRRPETKFARVEYDPRWGRSHEETGILASARTPDEMREAARELTLLADWFEQRPAAPEKP